MKVSQKQLIIEPTNGLCNRLRAMASGWILAKHLGRKFKVVWNATPDIGNAEFTDLFEKPNWLLPADSLGSVVVYTAGIKTEADVLAELCKNKSHTIVLKQTGGNYIPSGMTIERFNSLKSQFYNTLKPIPKINRKIQAFSKRYSLTDFVGVHIRRKDRKQFTPDTEMFARAIKRFDDVEETSNILLCTDESTEFEKLKKLCNSNIITYPKQQFNRNTIECVQDALVEWMLLSKCEKGIVYSHSSSFGYEACIVNKIPYTLALELRSTRQKTENEKRNLPKLVFELNSS